MKTVFSAATPICTFVRRPIDILRDKDRQLFATSREEIVWGWRLDVEWRLKLRQRRSKGLGRAKIEGMTPTRLQVLEACDSRDLSRAIAKLSERSGEDADACLMLFDGLLTAKLIEFSCPRRARQTRVDLTAAGREALFNERTRITGKKAHDILAELDD